MEAFFPFIERFGHQAVGRSGQHDDGYRRCEPTERRRVPAGEEAGIVSLFHGSPMMLRCNID
jgi:hypothetical protein